MQEIQKRAPVNMHFHAGSLLVATDSRWPFVGLFAYLASQAFTVPVMAVGPSWSLWPTLSDFAGWFLIAATFLSSGRRPFGGASRKQKILLSMLTLIVGGCVLSYMVHYASTNGITSGRATYREVAQYQLYRLVEFSLLYWAAINVSVTPKRIEILKKLLPWVLTVVCLGLILEFLGIVEPSIYAAHLPRDPSIAGAWSNYVTAGRFGRGTISYDHAYSSVQVLLLLALSLHLRGTRPRDFYNSALTMLAIIAIWTTGCRAVMAASLVFLGGVYFRKLLDLAAVLAVVAIIVLLIVIAFPNVSAPVYRAVAEQSATRATYDVDGVGGRAELWQRRIAFLWEEPSRLLIGAGIGSDTSNAAWPGGGNAHNLYLEIIVEHGAIGLIVFLWATSFVMGNVYRYDPPPKALFWACVAILVASFAQVTLYPIAWTGQFIGFSLVTISIALRKVRMPEPHLARQFVLWRREYPAGSICASGVLRLPRDE
jgi:O-antigen ligase